MTDLDGWQKETSPAHAGEIQIHDKLGITEKQNEMARRVVRPYMPDQHRDFFQQLPFLVVGSIDNQGNPWASMLFGKPGFIQTPDATHLDIHSRPNKGDPLLDNLKPEAPVSFLGIELSNYRRNRINATIDSVEEDGMTARVDQSFGNCPKYINKRQFKFLRKPDQPIDDLEVETFTTYDTKAREMILNADTFYVASYIETKQDRAVEGVDVNHRGGLPGFIKMEDDVLLIPDYYGNFQFNTLGNFVLNPKAGLTFVDFESGDIMYLTGKTNILWDDNPRVKTLPGAERAWEFSLEKAIRIKHAAPLQWEFSGYSPSFKQR